MPSKYMNKCPNHTWEVHSLFRWGESRVWLYVRGGGRSFNVLKTCPDVMTLWELCLCSESMHWKYVRFNWVGASHWYFSSSLPDVQTATRPGPAFNPQAGKAVWSSPCLSDQVYASLCRQQGGADRSVWEEDESEAFSGVAALLEGGIEGESMTLKN